MKRLSPIYNITFQINELKKTCDELTNQIWPTSLKQGIKIDLLKLMIILMRTIELIILSFSKGIRVDWTHTTMNIYFFHKNAHSVMKKTLCLTSSHCIWQSDKSKIIYAIQHGHGRFTPLLATKFFYDLNTTVFCATLVWTWMQHICGWLQSSYV